jgi:hypothetical protein
MLARCHQEAAAVCFTSAKMKSGPLLQEGKCKLHKYSNCCRPTQLCLLFTPSINHATTVCCLESSLRAVIWKLMLVLPWTDSTTASKVDDN